MPRVASQHSTETARADQGAEEQERGGSPRAAGLARDPFSPGASGSRTLEPELQRPLRREDGFSEEALELRIRTDFPLPIAIVYRAAAAIHEPEIRYKELLRVAENVLAFLATVGLSVAAHTGVLKNSDNAELTRSALMRCWVRGISPGHWQSLGQETGHFLRRMSPPVVPLIENIASLWYTRPDKESDFAAMTKRLVETKNDFKHDRGPTTPDEYAQANQALHGLLQRCLSRIAFVADYPLRLVEDVEVDWRTDDCRLDTLVYMGDHPVCRSETVTYPAALPAKKLYLTLTGHDWVSLYPLISVQYCPSCKTRETYMIDRWEGPSKPAVLRSFERGHTLRNDATASTISTDFQFWMETYLPRSD